MRSLIGRCWNAFDGLAPDTIWAAILDVCTLVTALLSFFMIQQVLTKAEYGSYLAVFAVTAPIGALSYSGPSLSALKAILRDKSPKSETLSGYLGLAMISSSVAAVFGFALALTVADFISVEAIAALIISELILTAFIVQGGFFLQAAAGFAAMARARLLLVAAKFVSILILVSHDVRFVAKYDVLDSFPHLVAPFEALTIRNLGLTYVLSYSAVLFIVYKKLLPKRGYKVAVGSPTRQHVKSSVAFGTPMVAGQVRSSGDQYIMGLFNQQGELGLYGAAYRVMMLATSPLKALEQAAFQRFFPDDDTVPGMHLRRSIRFTILMFSVALATSVVAYLALPLLDFLFDDEFKTAVDIVPWLLLFIPLNALASTPLNGLIGLGREQERSRIFISSSVLAIACYLALIPTYTWRGAVAGTVITEVFLAVVSWFFLVKYQKCRDIEIMNKANNLESI